MAGRIRVSNRGRLASRIPSIIEQLEPHIDAGMREAAVAVAETAKTLSPKETGRLARSIHVERRLTGTSTGNVRLLWWVVAWSREAFYGHFVEYGHKQRDGGWVPAHPFMVPAAELSRATFTARVNAAIRKACE